MKPTYTEQLAKLQLDRIAKRKAFWKEVRDWFKVLGQALFIIAVMTGVFFGVIGIIDWFSTQTKLRARVEALEQRPVETKIIYQNQYLPAPVTPPSTPWFFYNTNTLWITNALINCASDTNRYFGTLTND